MSHLETGPQSISAVRVLRVSLTDRCNFRCVYCMPADGVRWLPREDILTFEEICQVIRAGLEHHNIRRIKFTGGEPTVRHDLVDLVAAIRRIEGIEDLSLTTNGMLLQNLARPLKEAGLDRITVSLDSLQPERFKRITRTGDLWQVMRGLDLAQETGFQGLKVNCVMMRGINDDELPDFARLTLSRRLTVRFIEYMPLGDAEVMKREGSGVRGQGSEGNCQLESSDSPVGWAYSPTDASHVGAASADQDQRRHEGEGNCQWPIADCQLDGSELGTRNSELSPRPSHNPIAASEIGPAGGCGAQDRGNVFVSEAEAREFIERECGPLEPVDRSTEPGVGPAVVYRLAQGNPLGRIGFISTMSAPFCSTCNRLRLTANGVLRSCLFEGGDVDVRSILRNGTAPSHRQKALADAMTDCVRLKPTLHSRHGNEQMSRIGG